MPALNDIQKRRLIESMKKENDFDPFYNPFELFDDFNNFNVFDDEDDFDPFYDPDYDMDMDEMHAYAETLNIPQVVADMIRLGLLRVTETIDVLEDILMLGENPNRVADLNVENKLLRDLSNNVSYDDAYDDDSCDESYNLEVRCHNRLIHCDDDSYDDDPYYDDIRGYDRFMHRDEHVRESLRSLNRLMKDYYSSRLISYTRLISDMNLKRCKEFLEYEDKWPESTVYNKYKFVISKRIRNIAPIRNYKYLRSMRGFLDDLVSNNDDADNG